MLALWVDYFGIVVCCGCSMWLFWLLVACLAYLVGCGFAGCLLCLVVVFGWWVWLFMVACMHGCLDGLGFVDCWLVWF